MTTDNVANLQDLFRERAQRYPRASLDTLTRAVLNDILTKKKPEAFSLLFAAVREVGRHIDRNQVRAVERVYLAGKDKLVVDARIAFVEETFTLPGIGIVVWLDATVEEHGARITLLIERQQSIQPTIDAHRQAIAEIEEAGVKCLRQIKRAS